MLVNVGQGPEVGVGAIVLSRHAADRSLAGGKGGGPAHGPEAVGGDVRVLMVQRGRAPMLGRWSLPGGHVQRGEALRAAVAREVFEETGIEVVVEELIEVVEILDEGYHYVVLDYRCAPAHGGQAPEPGDDALAARYVLPSELPRLGATDAVIRVVAKALSARAGSSAEVACANDGGSHER